MTSLGDYNLQRDKLIQQERVLSHHYTDAEPTSKERHAIELIAALEEKEEAELWTAKEDASVWLGMPFTRQKSIIEKSKLFEILKQMPKGAILHCHLDAMNEPQSLLEIALSHESLCVKSSERLPFSTATIEFEYVPLTSEVHRLASPSSSLTASDYRPNTLIPAQIARNNFPGGPKSFDSLIGFKLKIHQKSEIWSPTQVWDHFSAIFILSNSLLNYAPVWKQYIKNVFRICRNDQIPYLECRINFLDEFFYREPGRLDLAHREWVNLFREAMQEVQHESRSDLPLWGARIIYSTIRFIEAGEGKGKLRWYLEDCIKLKKEFPDLIAGFDLVGWEDGLHPLKYYLEDLLWFQRKCKQEEIEIPFLLHAGETLGDGSKADMNLYDAILLDTKRIGHGFSLAGHPLLMQICRERGIAVESCPISNELLKYTASTANHPQAVLFNSNVPVVLSPDDPQIFGNSGLSYDFFVTLTASKTMNLLGLRKLARQSIQFSMMPPEEKKIRLNEFDLSFENFIDYVIAQLDN